MWRLSARWRRRPRLDGSTDIATRSLLKKGVARNSARRYERRRRLPSAGSHGMVFNAGQWHNAAGFTNITVS